MRKPVPRIQWPDYRFSSTNLDLYPHPIAQHAHNGHVVVDFLFTVLAFHHREVLLDAVSWSVLDEPRCAQQQLRHVLGIEPSFRLK